MSAFEYRACRLLGEIGCHPSTADADSEEFNLGAKCTVPWLHGGCAVSATASYERKPTSCRAPSPTSPLAAAATPIDEFVITAHSRRR